MWQSQSVGGDGMTITVSMLWQLVERGICYQRFIQERDNYRADEQWDLAEQDVYDIIEWLKEKGVEVTA